MAKDKGVLLEPIIRKHMSQFFDGYGNGRNAKQYKKNLKLSRFQAQPNPFQSSITYRALIKSEYPRDPNNSTGNASRRKKAASPKFVSYLVTVRFHNVDFGDEKSDTRNQEYEVAGRTQFAAKPSVKKNKAMLRCQCFTGDTKVLLSNGESISIRDLVDRKHFEVISKKNNGDFYISTATKAENFGKKEVYELTLSDGSTIKCTGDHKFMMKDGSYKQAKDLEGESLESLYTDENFKYYFKGAYKSLRTENTKKECYTYLYLDPRKKGNYQYGDLTLPFEPFYVGKGSGQRYTAHKNIATKGDMKTPFYKKLNKILSLGLEPIIIKDSNNVSENRALEEEKSLIRLIGRSVNNTGPLSNLSEGGDGISGHKRPDASDRMLSSNPMHNKDTVNKVQKTRKDRGINNGTNFNTQSVDVKKKMSDSAKERVALQGLSTKNGIKRKNLISWINSLAKGITKLNMYSYKDLDYCKSTVFYSAIEKATTSINGINFDRKNKVIHKAEEYNHKVVSVKLLGEEDVFCLTVPEYGNFVIETKDNNGVVVKNCRDFMMTWERPLALKGALWPNNVWTKYKRKTDFNPMEKPSPVKNPPYRNPDEKMGICKHIQNLIDYLVDNDVISQR